MGSDIRVYVERFDGEKWQLVKRVLRDRNYDLCAFLTGARNYHGIPCVVTPRGLPTDISVDLITKEYDAITFGQEMHSPTWVTLRELLDFDYDQTFRDEETGDVRRVREVLPKEYFTVMAEMEDIPDDPQQIRLTLWIDG